MNQTELNKWGLEITKNIYNYWLQLSATNNFIKENGFAVFYSPLIYKPKYLFIGLNPGGKFTKKDKPFNPDDIIKQLPADHDYLFESYDLAIAMRDLFNFNEQVIRESVKFNFYFFRTPSEKILKDQKQINEIYNFCSKQTEEIIKILQPEMIITEGLGVFDMLYNIMKFEKKELPLWYSNYRLIQTATKEEQKLIGLLHPSGARTRRRFIENKTIIVKELIKHLA